MRARGSDRRSGVFGKGEGPKTLTVDRSRVAVREISDEDAAGAEA